MRLAFAGATAYVLRAKARGWKLFCERMNLTVPLLWAGLPGSERLMRSIAAARRAASSPKEFLAWMNRQRPAGTPEVKEIKFTAEWVAEETEREFRERVRWWTG